MATSFKGWLSSWGNSWGTTATDPNAMRGSASFSFSATASVGGGILDVISGWIPIMRRRRR